LEPTDILFESVSIKTYTNYLFILTEGFNMAVKDYGTFCRAKAPPLLPLLPAAQKQGEQKQGAAQPLP